MSAKLQEPLLPDRKPLKKMYYSKEGFLLESHTKPIIRACALDNKLCDYGTLFYLDIFGYSTE